MNDENNDDVTLEPEEGNNKKSPYVDNNSSDGNVDDEFVPEDGEGNTGTTKDTVIDLRAKLKKAITEKQEYMDGWQRTKADFVNARKRDEESRKEMIKFATEGVLMDITPVLDSFTMAFNNKEAWQKVDANWRTGVEYIYNQLKGVLEQNGFVEFDPTGETFDPMKHNAIETIAVSDENQDHKVIEVVQKGYNLNGKIVRPASVKIGEFKKSE